MTGENDQRQIPTHEIEAGVPIYPRCKYWPFPGMRRTVYHQLPGTVAVKSKIIRTEDKDGRSVVYLPLPGGIDIERVEGRRRHPGRVRVSFTAPNASDRIHLLKAEDSKKS